MMAVLGFASFYKVNPLLPKRSFYLRLCGTTGAGRDPVAAQWFACRTFSVAVGNPFLCAHRWVCGTDRVVSVQYLGAALLNCT